MYFNFTEIHSAILKYLLRYEYNPNHISIVITILPTYCETLVILYNQQFTKSYILRTKRTTPVCLTDFIMSIIKNVVKLYGLVSFGHWV